jgi:hypothetical protein
MIKFSKPGISRIRGIPQSPHCASTGPLATIEKQSVI